MYSSAFGWNVLKLSMRSISSNVSFKTCISLLSFCFDDQSIGVRRVLKSPTIIVLLSISPFMSISVCLMYWEISLRRFPGGSDGKVSACNAGDLGSIPGLGRSPGEGNGNPLQYSCLENSVDGEAWWATVYGITKSRTGLSDFTFTFPSS